MIDVKNIVNQSMSLTLGDVSAEYFFQKPSKLVTYYVTYVLLFFGLSGFLALFDIYLIFISMTTTRIKLK